MIAKLIKHERILRSMLWLPIGLAMGAFLLALKETPPPGIPLFPRDFSPQYLFFPALFFWAILVPYLLASGAVVRSSRYQMTLPLPARRIWLAHVLPCTISALAALALAALVLILGNLLQGKPWLDHELGSVMLNMAAFIGLGLTLTHIPRRSLSELPMTGRHIAYLLAVWGGLIFIVPLASALPAYWAVVPAAVAFGLGAVLYSSLPPAFTLVQARVPSGREEDHEIAPTDGRHLGGRAFSQAAAHPPRPSRWLLPRTIIRCVHNPVLTPIVLVVILVFGLRNSGYQVYGASNLIFVFWTFVGLSTILVTGGVKLHLLDPLPVSRRAVFGYLVLPGLLVALLGYGLGGLTGKGADSESLVEYEERYYDRALDVRVPLEFWEIGRRGVPAPIQPCCDKPHAAWSVSLFKGTEIVLHNPYHAPADSSPEYVARQFSRAAEAVYGRQIPVQELLDRYFERGPEGGTVLKTGRFNLLDDYPGLRPVGWGSGLALVLLVIGAVWLLYLTLIFRLGHSIIKWGHVSLTVISVIFLFTMIWTSGQGITSEWKVSAGAGILLRNLTDTVPGGTAALWMIASAGILACFFLARAQFERMEIPVRPEQK
jgi:hypothetical protein